MDAGGQFKKILASDVTDASFLDLISKLFAEEFFNIHLELFDGELLVRLRQGKNLVSAGRYGGKSGEEFLRFIKSRANFKPHRTRLPESGSFACGDLLVKVFSLPVVGGEKLNLQLVKRTGVPYDLRQLGLWGNGLKALQGIPKLGSGLILTLGDGNLQTMFGILAQFDTHATSITTIEHAQTLSLPEIRQFVIEQDYGELAARTLKAATRQNPDVIVISQLDTPKLAELALKTSLDGKLVIAGLPISDSFLVPEYMTHLGVQPFLLTSQLRLVIGQAQVPATSPNSLKPVKVSAKKSAQILSEKHLDASALHKLEEQAKKAGLGQQLPLSSSTTQINTLYATAAKNLTRLGGIFEVIEMDKTLGDYFLPNLRAQEIRKAFIENGGVTKKIDHLVKALRGLLPYDVIN